MNPIDWNNPPRLIQYIAAGVIVLFFWMGCLMIYGLGA